MSRLNTFEYAAWGPIADRVLDQVATQQRIEARVEAERVQREAEASLVAGGPIMAAEATILPIASL